MKNPFISFIFSTIVALANAQSTPQQIKESFEKRKNLKKESILKHYPVRNVGPVVQGGRITDIAVHPDNPTHYYVAYASGGIFVTHNNGISFEPIFDNIDAIGIGDMALSPSDPSTIYVGTGEKNSSRSSYAGSGMYKSIDEGNSWKLIGLEGSQHISRVIVHPTDPNTVWVAVLGALYSNSTERGVYKSSDGGTTWKRTLYVSDSTGFVDLVINPQNPNQLWTTSWERARKSWNFKGSGRESTIYRSDDGGITWKKKVKGFPQGSHVGRIGLDVSPSQPNIIYALLDNQQETKKKKKKKKNELHGSDLLTMTNEEFSSLDDKKLNDFFKNKGYPKKYNATTVKEDILNRKYTLKDIAEYFGDANTALFDTNVAGCQLYKSLDAGDTWDKINSYDLDGVYFSYGYYFGEVRVSPTDPDQVYIFGVPLLRTDDGGRTFARLDTLGDVHVDHQALWINPKNTKHLLLGNDGGLYQSYDQGTNWLHLNNLPVGQFYTVNFDKATPYNIYGGLQDNGVLVGSSKSIPNRTKHWDKIMGGDGMYVLPHPKDDDIVYSGFQFGNYYRTNKKSKKSNYITPKHNIGEEKLRFNWRTPLLISHHNAEIVYIGAQKLYKSHNSGDNWEAISPELTNNFPQGNVPYSTITALSESPISPRLLYVGTDDGNIQVSTNGGGSWQQITSGLPPYKWVSSIHASSHDQQVVYATLNGYRDDDFNTYVYKSDNQGKDWKLLKSNLPNVVTNIIAQDPVNPDVLYLGTDHGTYVSLDDGKQWHLLNGLLNVSAYDMKVHPRENELIIGTHGRSIFVVDVKPLQQLDPTKAVVAFDPLPVIYSDKWGEAKYAYLKPKFPESKTMVYVNESQQLAVEINQVLDNQRTLILLDEVDVNTGFNYYNWNLKRKNYNKNKISNEKSFYVKQGKYEIIFKTGKQESKALVEVK